MSTETVHRVLEQHPVEVADFRRRGGWSWWCGCLTDGEQTHPDPAGAWRDATRHQAEQIAAALAADPARS